VLYLVNNIKYRGTRLRGCARLVYRTMRTYAEWDSFSDVVLLDACERCPPDLQAEAVKTVLMQAELLCKEWAA